MSNTSYLPVFLLLLSVCGQARGQNALTSKGARIKITSGSALRVNGNILLGTGSDFNNDGSFSTSGTFTTDQGNETPSLGTLTFNGTTPQTFEGNGIFLAKNVIVDNPAGLLLNSPLKVDGTFSITSGIITTSSSASPLILSENASVNDVSDEAHVNGYVRREGVGSFSYPVGNGSKYQPIVVNLDANSNGFQVKYFSGDAGSGTFTNTGASNIPLESYNTQEYWDLAPVGTASGRVTVSWDETNNPSITASEDLAIFKVAHKTSAGWLNEGSSAVTGTIGNGSVTSETLSNWSPFTLGAISEAALPVTLADFRARLIENQVKMEWSTSQEENASHFEVQRSADAKHFTAIATVDAIGNNASLHRYAHTDNTVSALSGTIYYRLRLVDADQSFAYSRTVAVKLPPQGLLSSVYPNPVSKSGTVIVESGAAADKLEIYNIAGIRLPIVAKRLSGNKIEISTGGLASGIYLIKVDTGSQKAYHRLIVQ